MGFPCCLLTFSKLLDPSLMPCTHCHLAYLHMTYLHMIIIALFRCFVNTNKVFHQHCNVMITNITQLLLTLLPSQTITSPSTWSATVASSWQSNICFFSLNDESYHVIICSDY